MGYPYFGVSDAPESVCAAFGSGRSCAFNMSDDSFYHYRECVCDFFYASRFSEIKRDFCASGFYVMNFWFLRI